MPEGETRVTSCAKREEFPRTENIVLLCSWPRRLPSDVEPLDTFARIAEVEWPCLYRAALRMGADAHEAEDIVQDSLLRAYRRLAGMKREELLQLQVHWWLKSLLRRVAVQHGV